MVIDPGQTTQIKTLAGAGAGAGAGDRYVGQTGFGVIDGIG
jgi:hypothetical protein